MNTNTNTSPATYYNSKPMGEGGFKGWSAKHLGSKPDDTMLNVAHRLGLRPGKQALAVSMALRPEGVSGSQIVMASGAPQLNRMRGLIAAGVVKRDMNTPANPQGQSVYKLTLTPKGEKVIERAAVLADKAALDTGEAKPVKAKTKKAAAAPRKRKAKVTVPEQAPAPEAPVSTEGLAPADVADTMTAP
jgi:hypothetical protein